MRRNGCWTANQKAHFCCAIRHRKTFCSRCRSGSTVGRCMHASNNLITNLGWSSHLLITQTIVCKFLNSSRIFSFDCHDPGVYTSSSVTGLLEHYKDPACVMFFEPALTLPLNRNFAFSLQQLCRASIVHATTYDGINSLSIPKQLKAYLKEYHYKQRVRVKKED